jgi:alanine racemase
MKSLRTPIAQTRRDAWSEVNLSHIEHNFRQIKNVVDKDVKVMAVVKADSYGHGATIVAKTLSAIGVGMFGVASVDEGIQLRLSDIKRPILILGPTPAWALGSAIDHDLHITIFSDMHLKDTVDAARRLKKQANVHIKIDTGMHRIGISHIEAPEFIKRVQQTSEVNLAGIFSHLACAENRAHSEKQIHRWEGVLEKIEKKPEYLHFTNSSALLVYRDIHYNLVRSGLEIYGLQPDLPEDVTPLAIKQAMSLKARITHLHRAQVGEGVSYGYKYQIKEKEVIIATIPVGYADGVSRRLSNKIYGVVNGQKVKQIGVITMDQMMFDVTEVPGIHEGELLTLLGYDGEHFLSIDEWAKILGTINYEIPCLLKVRLPRVFTS